MTDETVNENASSNHYGNDTHLNKRLLVVEDNIDMRSFLERNLSDDFDVVCAGNGKEALEALARKKFDIIVSDLMMPEMDGVELCDVVRKDENMAHIPIVLLTARTDINTKIESIERGADVYIEKPFSLRFLKVRLASLLNSREQLLKRFSEQPLVSLRSVAPDREEEQILQKMSDVIEKHISDPDFSVDQLAEELCISRSSLFAKVKATAEITPNELIQLMRLKKGARLLSEKKYRVNEVAFMVGFNNPSYFTKCFQKQFGMKPLEFIHSMDDVTPDQSQEAIHR